MTFTVAAELQGRVQTLDVTHLASFYSQKYNEAVASVMIDTEQLPWVANIRTCGGPSD